MGCSHARYLGFISVLMMAGADESQWIEWYKSLEKPLYNIAYRCLWDAAESQDVVQEAFLRCWKIRDRVVAETFKALIFRTTLNVASNRVRRRKRWRFIPFVEAEVPPPEQVQCDTLATKELRLALDQISEPLKQALLLSELGGLSYKEIADVLEISEGTVGSRRSRAIAILRNQLAAKGVEWHED